MEICITDTAKKDFSFWKKSGQKSVNQWHVLAFPIKKNSQTKPH